MIEDLGTFVLPQLYKIILHLGDFFTTQFL